MDSLDEITARAYLNSALQQFLGLTGTAIPIDILKVHRQNVCIRVPREDEDAVAAALSQWSNAAAGLSLQIQARGTWLGMVAKKGTCGTKLWTLEP